MLKASEADLDLLVKTITENEMGFALIEADAKSFLDILAEKTTYNDKQGMFGNGEHVSYHLYHLNYTHQTDVTSDLVHCRHNALHNIFCRWTELGYNKRHAKDPFNCKAFMKYMDEIGFSTADYMLLMVE